MVANVKGWLEMQRYEAYTVDPASQGRARVYFLTDEATTHTLLARALPFNTSTPMDLPGLQLYQKYCYVCHGVDGDGDGIMTNLIGIMPMDHTNPNEIGRIDNIQLIKSILDGKGRFMPAWRGILSQSDVEALVSYIRLLPY